MLLRPALLALLAATAAPADDAPTYERDVRPVLARRCLTCHTSRKLERREVSGGLALESFEALRRGVNGRAVVRDGRSADSPLYLRLVEADDEKRMPYLEDALPGAERTLIQRWIDAGAPRGETSGGTPEPATLAATPRTRRVNRTLDVVLPTALKVPAGREGLGPGGAAAAVLRVGPLPAVTALGFSGDGRWLAVGSVGRAVVWDLEERRPAVVLDGLPGPVHALAFSRDGRRLALGGGLPARSGSVRVYTVPDGTLRHDLVGHTDAVYGVAFAPDDARLATAGFDGSVRLWDLADGRALGSFTGHSDFVYDVAFAADGRTLLSASKDRSIKRIDAATLQGVRTYSDHEEDVFALAVKPDGSGFVSAGAGNQLRLWAADGDAAPKKVGGGPILDLALSADGSRLLGVGGASTVRLWDPKTGTPGKTLAGPTDVQYAAALSPDGRRAAAAGWDGLVRIWDTDSTKLTLTLIQPPGQPGWLALAPDGTLAADPELLGLVRWRVGDQEVPAEAFAAWQSAPKAK